MASVLRSTGNPARVNPFESDAKLGIHFVNGERYPKGPFERTRFPKFLRYLSSCCPASSDMETSLVSFGISTFRVTSKREEIKRGVLI